jgi:demethylmenaquinone methyltransferase/2-methoxy-6-polyprenyl-1,4-benzoquinol methylase
MEEEYLGVARKKMLPLGLSNVDFVAGRAEDVLLDRPFDCIISSYLAKYADLPALIAAARSMLRDGGTLVMHDFTYPRNRAFAALWSLHFVLLQTVGTRLYPQWQPAFDGLPALLRQSTWLQDLCELLRANGFSGITVESLTFGAAAIVTGRKAGGKQGA